MQQSKSMFVEEIGMGPATIESNLNFNVEEVLWSSEQETDNQLYQQITFKVSRNPKLLIAHLQRIHFTHKQGWSEKLYAALTDLFVSLNGKGRTLSIRMLVSTRSLLSEQQYQQLEKYLSHYNNALLVGNKFSLLTQGLVGSTTLLNKTKKLDSAHDPLTIARDFVEYSQLDDAKKTLEAAIIDDPERLELQNDLLELYQLTDDAEAFTKMHTLLREQQFSLSNQWNTLKEQFSRVKQ